MQKPLRIGVFSGTFDPPHLAHLHIAHEARKQLELDSVFWTVTPDPPHKQSAVVASIEHRIAMIKLTIDPFPYFEICTVDMERPGPHFAVDTIKIIADQNRSAELIYILGGDLLSSFEHWIRITELVALCSQIGIIPRQENSYDLKSLENAIPGGSEKIRVINVPASGLSSHDIRNRCKSGESIAEMVSPPVYRYIKEHRLYG